MTWGKSLPTSRSARRRYMTITDALQTWWHILDWLTGEEHLSQWISTGVSA
jgi:hypothetical protein